MLRILRTTLGFALLGVGVVGLLVPVLPGIPLILAGVVVVGPDHPVIRSIRARWDHWRDRKETGR